MLSVMQLDIIFSRILWLFKKRSNHHLRITLISFVVQPALDALIKYKLQYMDLSHYPY